MDSECASVTKRVVLRHSISHILLVPRRAISTLDADGAFFDPQFSEGYWTMGQDGSLSDFSLDTGFHQTSPLASCYPYMARISTNPALSHVFRAGSSAPRSRFSVTWKRRWPLHRREFMHSQFYTLLVLTVLETEVRLNVWGLAPFPVFFSQRTRRPSALSCAKRATRT